MAETPKNTTKHLKIENELAKNVSELSKQVAEIKNMEVIQILKRPYRLMWLSFLKGVMAGFGSVLGATFLVAIFIYILSKMSFVPYIGDKFQSIIDKLEVKEETQNTENTEENEEATISGEEIKTDEVNIQTEQVNIQEEATNN